jgi:type VI secretion system protein ImpH
MISLFYRAWEKYRFQSGGEADAEDTLAEALKAIVGEDSKNDDFWKIPAGELTVYAGVLAGGNRSPALLEGVVSDYFGIENVKVTQFFPKRIKLSGRQRTKIGFNGQNNQLGKDIVIGGSMLDHSGWFKLSLGPLKQQVFDAFLPGREGYKKLVFLVNLFTRQQLHFELELILEACEVQGTWASAQNNHQRLGRTTWLGKPESKTVSIKLTA